MATEKVGVYRKWMGAIPTDKNGRPLDRSEWSRKRPFRWVVRWFGSDGKRYSRSFVSRKEAIKYAETRQADVRNGKRDEPQRISLQDFCELYLDIRSDLAHSTRVEYARTLGLLKEFLGDDTIVSRITPLAAKQFVAWYRKREYRGRTPSPATVNKLIRECHRIFREAVTCLITSENPFAEVRQEKVGQRPWHHVSPAEYEQLVEAAPSNRWRTMISLGYCCGLRVGEVLNLTWSDVDFEQLRIRVTPKRGTELRAAWTPKDKDARIVPVPDHALRMLIELELESSQDREYVFVNRKGCNAGKRMTRNNAWRDFQAIRNKAGVPKCSFHDLRKSYCTNLAGAVPLHVVQELAGHADIRTTRRHYLQVRDEQIDTARCALEQILQ